MENLVITDSSFSGSLEGRCLSARHLIGPPLRPGTLGTIGEFELIKEIGRGGMSVVYLAKRRAATREKQREVRRAQPFDSAFVAVKMLREALVGDERAVLHFRREARLLRQLDHPHILKVLEFGSTPCGDFMVLPYLRRGNLAAVMTRSALKASDIRRIARQTASALGYAHGRGIVHRDLSLRNILVDDLSNCYLSDFGLSRGAFDMEALEPGGTPCASMRPSELSPRRPRSCCNSRMSWRRTAK